jgi:hypothetical protein
MGAHDERIPAMTTHTGAVLDGIDTSGGVFDSRAVIERMAELDLLLSDDDDEHPDSTLDIEREERAALRAFVDDMETNGPADWQYGETFIAEYAFEDHARELAEDIGAIDSNASWPLSYIDWPAAADALRMDYSAVEIDGTTWYYRS